jgi:RHS repeat-associated protein
VCEVDGSAVDCADPDAVDFVSDVVYDVLGRRDEVHTEAGVRSYDYSLTTQRMTQDRFDGDGPGGYWIERNYTQFDQIGNILQITGSTSDGQVDVSASYTYDRRNRLASWDRATTAPQFFSYDLLGNMVEHGVASPGSVNQFFEHPTKPHAITSRADPFGTAYAYDADGNRISEAGVGGVRHFSFDSANRLVCQGSSAGSCSGLRVGYDAAGSRIVEYDSEGTRRIYLGGHFTLIGAQEAEWHIQAFGETIAYKYDDSVTLRAASSFWLPLPDLRGLEPLLGALALAALASGGAVAVVRWRLAEPLARRPAAAAAAWTLVLLVALPPLPVSGGGGGGGVLLYRWLLTDHLGSGVAWLDQDGEPVRQTVYAPFGAVAQGAVNGGYRPPHVFAGHQRNEATGLHYMQARWQDPSTGAFVSVDPLVPNVEDPQSVNAYTYASNNPIAFTDPTGMCNPITGCSEVPPSSNAWSFSWDLSWSQFDAAGCRHECPSRPPPPNPTAITLVGTFGPGGILGDPSAAGAAMSIPGPAVGPLDSFHQSLGLPSQLEPFDPGKDPDSIDPGHFLWQAFSLISALSFLEGGLIALEGVVAVVGQAAATGALATAAGAAATGTAVLILISVGGFMVAVGLENVAHQATGATPISSATGIPLPIFSPAPGSAAPR